MSFKVFDDADTGDEILWFMRRGKPYLYLRDAQTKRFIKRLKAMELRMFEVVDYDEEEARKGNPLYVDVVTSTYLFPSKVEEVEDYEEGLHERAKDKTTEMFGTYVTDQLLDRSGLEYGSELRIEFEDIVTRVYEEWVSRPTRRERMENINLEPEKWFWCVVWKHRKEQEPKSEEGFEKW